MSRRKLHILLNYLFALVWLLNGLFSKVLNLVPRHEEIVGRILGTAHAHTLVVIIGLLEICMAIWIISGIKARLNAVMQIALILAMNLIEFFVAPDLLLWGKMNLVFALAFILLIYYNAFVLTRKTTAL